MDISELTFMEEIGKGNFSTVFKGMWRGETVALKKIVLPCEEDVTTVSVTNRELAALRLTFIKL